jgi:hypothetical protein
MLRVYGDFNDKTPDGGCWILQHAGEDIEAQPKELGLNVGDHILLYQDPDDFEVEASLDFRFVEVLGRQAWIAFPDWGSINRNPMPTRRRVSVG